MGFPPWQLLSAYLLDLVWGDPRWMPHPVRWIGALINRLEAIFHDGTGSPTLQRVAGCAFWAAVVSGTVIGSIILLAMASQIHPWFGWGLSVWLAYTALATRSLHRESAAVAAALEAGNLELARSRLSLIVSRDTGSLEEGDILRAVVETVAENVSDGIVAPIFYLALGGPAAGLAYKAVNTMDSMVGYENARYRYFGWGPARADDVANWIPARLSGLLLVAAAALLRFDWRASWRVMRRDARKMKSPNAGFPEAAVAGALHIQLGGTNVYFGQAVEKPTLGDGGKPITLETYRAVVRLLYTSSLLALTFGLVLGAVLESLR